MVDAAPHAPPDPGHATFFGPGRAARFGTVRRVSWIPLAVAAGVALLVALWVALTYNKLRALQYACDDAWSLVDVQLQRRADLVPNLVSAVSAYAAHERAVLEAVTEARARANALHDPTPATAAAEARLSATIRDTIALREAYPELKASQQFVDLQHTISDLGDQIAASREIYNGNVAVYRNLIGQVPSNWVARQFSFGDRTMFAAPDLQGRLS